MSRCQEHPHEQVPVAAAAISLFASLSSVLELVLDVVQKNTKKSQPFGAEGINFLSGSAGTSDLGQLHTVLPSSKTAFLDLFSRLSFLSGPTGTTDSPGASPSAWASSTQSSQRAKLLIHIYFHDLFFCLAPPGPQIHLVHPHQPGPTPHSPPSEQNRFFQIYIRFFSVRPHRGPQIHLVHPHQPQPVPRSPPSEQDRFFPYLFSRFVFFPVPPKPQSHLGPALSA